MPTVALGARLLPPTSCTAALPSSVPFLLSGYSGSHCLRITKEPHFLLSSAKRRLHDWMIQRDSANTPPSPIEARICSVLLIFFSRKHEFYGKLPSMRAWCSLGAWPYKNVVWSHQLLKLCTTTSRANWLVRDGGTGREGGTLMFYGFYVPLFYDVSIFIQVGKLGVKCRAVGSSENPGVLVVIR